MTEITANTSYQEPGPRGELKPLEQSSYFPARGNGIVQGASPPHPSAPADAEERARIAGWIFFDADCTLCAGSAKRTAAFLGRHGLVLVPLQTPGAAERVGVTLADLLTRMHLLTREGRRFAGADALVEIARHINWARPLAVVAGSPLVLPRLRRIYDWVAANRYCFGGTCAPPRRSSALDWLPLLILHVLALALRGFMAGWVFLWAQSPARKRAHGKGLSRRKTKRVFFEMP